MRLSLLFDETGVPVPEGMAGLEIAGLANDSRDVRPGSLFVAITGFSDDGHSYAEAALEAGAAAILVERATGLPSEILNPSGNNRPVLARIASKFYSRPWDGMRTVGITGTNGKTSTAHMTRWILEKQGIRCGLLGTVGHVVAGNSLPARETTPDALALARLLSEMRAGGDGAAVMEVSSHALAQARVDELEFDAALFTNITQDHLDFHGTMEEYLRVKLHLLDLLKPGGTALFGTCARGWPDVPGASTFGFGPDDDFSIAECTVTAAGISYALSCPGCTTRVHMKVPARVNVYNSAGAIAACVSMGFPAEASARALDDFPGVPGRLEVVDEGQGFLVAVDYAHTPDALERVLRQARELASGRVITVFGAGGDRDRTKRPRMGAIAEALSDEVFVTSDNPRTENPMVIIDEILKGVSDRRGVHVEADRRSAIRCAIAAARPGDVVVIAGKGHEDYQILGRERVRFDDREEARIALGRLK
jgi:UDP-N-acetylmuramoyl-L-alanyl-D-glutamate--2,6-diaminopimelate ligase